MPGVYFGWWWVAALLRLAIDLHTCAWNQDNNSIPIPIQFPIRTARYQKNNQLKVIAYTSIGWLCILFAVIVGFIGIIGRQVPKLELLIERTRSY